MSSVIEYHRPATLEEAVALAARPGTVVLAGGTAVNAGHRPVGGVLVDLQALGLDGIRVADDGSLTLGAMVRLSAMASADLVPGWLRELARKEQPSSLRTVATVGGTLFSGGWESALLAGLLACDALAETIGTNGGGEVAVADLVQRPERVAGSIVTAVQIRVDGPASVHATARTSADRPIVACVARRAPDGVRLAMSGVASAPMLVGDLSALEPPGDFRGSSGYRRHLAAVLSSRALAEIGANR
jgi:CO/xanthine dehydrogenase FAD-binding subunit